MTIGYRFLLATVQEVTARMFTTTLRSQPVYSRSRLSELPALESPVGSTKWTQTMQVTETPPLADGFPASQVHPHIYMMQPFLHSFSMHMPNGKPELMLLLDVDTEQGTRPRGVNDPNVGCTLCLGLPYKNSVLKAVFNETTHCVLLHSLSSFTLY